MFDQASSLLHKTLVTPSKLSQNKKDVQKIVQAFLFNEKLQHFNQSSMKKSFDSNFTQKQILQGEIRFLMLIIKHLKHIYARKELQNKNLEKLLQHYKAQINDKDQQKNSLPKVKELEMSQIKVKKTLKKQQNKSTCLQSIQSVISCFQDEPKTVKILKNNQIQMQNEMSDIYIKENKQLKKCLEERDQKISDLVLESEKIKTSFKKMYQELKILAKEKQQLIVEHNIYSLKCKNQRAELQFQIQNLENEKDTLKQTIKKLQQKIDQQYDQANYKQQCEFLRVCFKKELDNNYQLNSSKIKLMKKIKHLQKELKKGKNTNSKNQPSEINSNQNIPKALKFNLNQSEEQNQQKINYQKSFLKFKKNSPSSLIIANDEKFNKLNLELQKIFDTQKQQKQMENSDAKIQSLMQKLVIYSIKLQELSKIIQLSQKEKLALKQQIKNKVLQKEQQINQIKVFFENQLNLFKNQRKNTQQHISRTTKQIPKEQQNDNFNKCNSRCKNQQIEQNFYNIQMFWLSENQKIKVLQQKLQQKDKQIILLTDQVRQQDKIIHKLKQKEFNWIAQTLPVQKENKNLQFKKQKNKTLLTERRKVSYRYSQIQENEYSKIQQKSQDQFYLNRSKQILVQQTKFQQNQNIFFRELSYNSYFLDNFNIFRGKLTQFYENIMHELQNWQAIQLVKASEESSPNKFQFKDCIQKKDRKETIQMKAYQQIDKSFEYQLMIENILKNKIEQFQEYSQFLLSNQLREKQNKFQQEAKSCKSQLKQKSFVENIQDNMAYSPQKSYQNHNIFKSKCEQKQGNIKQSGFENEKVQSATNLCQSF